MELKEFITETLSQIIDGVSEVQEKYKNQNVLVNPDNYSGTNGEYRLPPKSGYYIPSPKVQHINMDIALTITENAGQKSGIGIAKVISAGISSETNAQNSTISKVKFDIPICLPTVSSDAFLEKIGRGKNFEI